MAAPRPTAAAADDDDHGISFAEAFWVWCRVALLSFGGPAGQIAVMHRILVEEKRWIGERRFLHALNYCMLLPGPEAQQLATYVGWLLHRTKGGLVAGTLFVLPGFLSILVLSLLYAGFQQTMLVQALFFGIKAAVLAVVVQAVIRIAGRALKTPPMHAIAAAAFLGLFFLDLPFPLIIAMAALAGLIGDRLAPRHFRLPEPHPVDNGAAPALDALLDGTGAAHARPSLARTLKVAALWLALWLVPVGVLLAVLGPQDVFSQIAVFFSKLAVVTFGGAYAVLAWMAQEAVQHHGWLQPGEMLDGLGMAESTPGPLIQVVQFVAFLGAFREATGLDPFVAGVLASLLATWVTFTPCFLWIFAGAPYVEALRGRHGLTAALSAITAAVVGVIASLALWFALHFLFGEIVELRSHGLRLLMPLWASLDLAALLLSAGAMVALLRWRLGLLATLAACAAAGLAIFMLRG
ncbi:chromate efflux transporter [Marinimicrococcus flavescens]|uniref:Chromate efflux transporter n=1 Tax=Marinimicrococcus flavescens TaxID=3031815 RepID=A0AAP3V142_9PROT|nr:chromate efflux transporter [Marinimicrococcus flavescens]